MKRNWILVVVGMAIYVGAFFLIGARDAHPSPGDRGYPGYFCAYITLVNPWGHDGMTALREDAVQYFAVLFSGWINPLFLITLLASWLRPKGRPALVLRVALLIMLIAPWVVFYRLSLYPREGYFLWTVGILLVMFSVLGARLARGGADDRERR